MAEDTVKYVYTKKFAIYSKGVRRAGELVHSDYVDFNDKAVLARFIKRGFIRPARKGDMVQC